MFESASLVLQHVSVARGGRLLLKDVIFDAPAGAFIALRGPNGAGKTSLLRAMAGLAPPVAGDMRIGAVSQRADPEAYRERILLGGHLDAVKPSLSLRENLGFWTRFYGAGRDAAALVDHALERFGLSAQADAPAGHCSAGQKRRLGLARLAAARRPVWLLDEPTVSLDAASVQALSALITEHCEGGGVAVAATHQDFPIPESRSVDVSVFAPTPRGARGPQEDQEPFRDPFLEGFDDEERAGEAQ